MRKRWYDACEMLVLKGFLERDTVRRKNFVIFSNGDGEIQFKIMGGSYEVWVKGLDVDHLDVWSHSFPGLRPGGGVRSHDGFRVALGALLRG